MTSPTITIIATGNVVDNHISPYFFFCGGDGCLLFLWNGTRNLWWDEWKWIATLFENYFANHLALSCRNRVQTRLGTHSIIFDGLKFHIRQSSKGILLYFLYLPQCSHIWSSINIYYRDCSSNIQKKQEATVAAKHEIANLGNKPYLKAMSPETSVSFPSPGT